MSKVIVDSEDLLALVRACEEYDLDARAHRATWTTLRLTVDNARLDLRYGEVYRSERDQYATTAKRKYEPISQAIADGTLADLALKQVADRLRR